MLGEPGDKSTAPTQGNAQLPPKQHKNQQNSNPQSAMSGQIQQADIPLHGIQPASQQQLMQQQQVGPHTNQQIPVQAKQQNLMQQPISVQPVSQQDGSDQSLPQHLQISIQGSQSFQQQQSQNCSPQISPSQNVYAPNAYQALNQTQTQILQQIPPQPLFQQHAGHVMQNQMMQPQQLQQPYQQPMAMLQTPILHSNSPVTNSPQKAIKKGRFRVVKGAPNEAKAVSAAGGNDNQSVLSPNNTQVGAEMAPQPVSTVKKGRFVVKKATACTNTAVAECAAKADIAKTAKQTANEKDVAVAQTKPGPDPCTKKKGRFLVKTGGSSANLSALEMKSPPTATAGAETVSTGTGVPAQQNASWVGSGLDETVKTDQSAANGEAVCTKKKGRFVVKTGGNAASLPAVANTAPSAPEGMQNNGIGNAQIIQLTSTNPHLPNYIAVDANGQVMGVLNVALPLSQTSQLHPLQQISASQLQGRSQFVHTPVLNAASSVVSQTHPQQKPHPPHNPSDAYPQVAPVSRQRAMTDERSSENGSSTSKAHVPRSYRPCGSSGPNWSSGTRAATSSCKNGRLIGSGGVGKVLHHLDTLRSEVVEADHSIASLQSDNRILRDKNKELEAKNKELERRLAEEKYLRHTAEVKCRTLNQNVRDQEIDLNANQTQTGPARHQPELVSAPSAGGRLENQGITSLNTLQPMPEIAIDHTKQAKASAPKAVNPLQPPIRMRSLTIPDKPPHSRMNSLDTSDAARSHVALSQPMTGVGSIAKNFDPLGTALPSSVHQTNDMAVAMTSVNKEHVAITMSPQPGDAKCTANASTRTKHFDPLGTPRRGSSEMNTIVPALVLYGVPQMPAMATHMDNGNVALPVIVPVHHQHQHSNQQEDPFDEIVLRIPHSQGTI